MDFDLKYLIWGVVLIVYVIKQIMKLTGVKPTQPEEPIEQTAHTARRQIPKTIEYATEPKPPRPTISSPLDELMKEMGMELPNKPKEIAAKNISKYPTSKQIEVVDYDDNIESELAQVERIKKENKLKAERQKISNPSLADEHFEPYSLAQNKESTLIKKIRNPEDLRDALVIGEILNRKY